MALFALTAFLLAILSGLGFFFISKRYFDFLTIAYVGAVFYFAPLLVGKVLQSSPELPSTVPPVVYGIATMYVLGLVLAGILVQRHQRDEARMDRSSRALSGYYLALAVSGIAGSLISTHGAIINADKVLTLAQIGYFYTLFEVAASLCCISAVVERRWWMAAVGAFLLSIDLFVGFRPFVVLTSLGVALVLLTRCGRIRLFMKAPTYGTAAFALLVAMFFVHSVRFVIFDKIAEIEGVPTAERVTKTWQMRSDTIQFLLERNAPSSAEGNRNVSRWISIPLRLFQESEPFIVQATLVGVAHTGLSCPASNILKSVFLLVPPGLRRFFPNNPFPSTFYDEYQPILYPNITYGTGGNIWAEMLCRFGYAGVATFGLLLLLTLVGLRSFLLKARPSLVAPIAFGGGVVAFYIYRNDLHYTLVMLRQVGFVFVAAYGLSVIARKIQCFLLIKIEAVRLFGVPARVMETQSKTEFL